MGSDDFLFQNRNKEYGAYKLRKLYKKTVLFSLLISLTTVFLSFFIPFLINLKQEFNEDFLINPAIIQAELTPLDLDEHKNEEEPKPQKKAEPDIPEVKKDEMKVFDNNDSLKNAEKLAELNKKTDANELNGEGDDVRLKGDAVFRCGGNLDGFRNWFTENFKFPDDPKLYKKEGKVIVQFIVSKRGLIDTVNIVSSLDPLIDKEVKRVILSAPKWKPCYNDGHYIPVVYTFPIFIVGRK